MINISIKVPILHIIRKKSDCTFRWYTLHVLKFGNVFSISMHNCLLDDEGYEITQVPTATNFVLRYQRLNLSAICKATGSEVIFHLAWICCLPDLTRNDRLKI